MCKMNWITRVQNIWYRSFDWLVISLDTSVHLSFRFLCFTFDYFLIVITFLFKGHSDWVSWWAARKQTVSVTRIFTNNSCAVVNKITYNLRKTCTFMLMIKYAAHNMLSIYVSIEWYKTFYIIATDIASTLSLSVQNTGRCKVSFPVSHHFHLMARSHCTGTGTRNGTGTMVWSHSRSWTFLHNNLMFRSQSRSRSRAQAVWTCH